VVLWALAACVLAFLGLSSCAWRVISPDRVVDPVPIFLSEYGRHTRLALPDGTAAFFEYGFGEWNFYGLEEEGIFSGLRAIIGLGEGALSRRKLPYTLSESEFVRAAGSSRSARIMVEGSLAGNLRDELESRWRSNSGSIAVRRLDEVPVSRDPSAYHLFGNSNHAVAKWLGRLGCRVRGYPITSHFEVIAVSDVSARRAPRQPDGETPL